MTKRILLVEDDLPTVNALTRVARVLELDVKLAHARSSADARTKLTPMPDALILDVRLGPDDSGLDFLRWLRLRGVRIPAAVFSGFVDFDVVRQSRALGAVVFPKPSEPADMFRWLMGGGKRNERVRTLLAPLSIEPSPIDYYAHAIDAMPLARGELRSLVSGVERDIIAHVYASKGSVNATAKHLAVDRRHVQRKLKNTT